MVLYLRLPSAILEFKPSSLWEKCCHSLTHTLLFVLCLHSSQDNWFFIWVLYSSTNTTTKSSLPFKIYPALQQCRWICPYLPLTIYHTDPSQVSFVTTSHMLICSPAILRHLYFVLTTCCGFMPQYFFKPSLSMKYHSFLSTFLGLTNFYLSSKVWLSHYLGPFHPSMGEESFLFLMLYTPEACFCDCELHTTLTGPISLPISVSACTLFQEQKSYYSRQYILWTYHDPWNPKGKQHICWI